MKKTLDMVLTSGITCINNAIHYSDLSIRKKRHLNAFQLQTKKH